VVTKTDGRLRNLPKNYRCTHIRRGTNSPEIIKGCERDAHSPICYKVIRSGLCSAFSVSQNQAAEAEQNKRCRFGDG